MEKSLFKKIKNIVSSNLNIFTIIVVSAVFGFIYETIFYKIDLGYFIKRGTTFGPWVPIYGVGGLFIYLLTKKVKDKPFLVFLFSFLVCGILEFLTGYLLYNLFDMRLWDYNIEIWNWGNVGGYICLRSLLFFGLSGLFLMYVIAPYLDKAINRFSKKIATSVTFSLFSVFLIDTIYNFFAQIVL